jgi:hypothetical protein
LKRTEQNSVTFDSTHTAISSEIDCPATRVQRPRRLALLPESAIGSTAAAEKIIMSKSSDVTRRTAIRVAIAGAAAVATGAARAPRQGAGGMERVEGIGGFFFRAKDPKKLAEWANPISASPASLTKHTMPVVAHERRDHRLRTVQGGHVGFHDRRFQWMINFPRPRPRQDGRPASPTRHHGRTGP